VLYFQQIEPWLAKALGRSCATSVLFVYWGRGKGAGTL
jgi:hypothetical protein